MTTKEYWENFYKNFKEETPSLFAQFVLNFIKDKKSIIDLGCGTGRDSIYFHKNGFNVIGIDQVVNKQNQENLIFYEKDFTKLDGMPPIDVVYMRFSLHAIKENDENLVLNWAYNNLNQMGLICIEARSSIGICTRPKNHYRRLISLTDLETKLVNLGFKIIFSKEQDGWAPYYDEDPIVLRLIAQKCSI